MQEKVAADLLQGRKRRFQITLAETLIVMAIAALAFQYVAPYFQNRNREVFPLGSKMLLEVAREFKGLGVTTSIQPQESGAFSIYHVRFLRDGSVTELSLQRKLIDSISVSLREKFGESVSASAATNEVEGEKLLLCFRQKDSHWKIKLITISDEPHDTYASGEFRIIQIVERSGWHAQ